MLRKLPICLAALVAIMSLAVSPKPLAAMESGHLSRKQVRILNNGGNAASYQKLVTYFRRQQMLFHTKAQNALDEYANHASRFNMLLKFTTREQIMERVRNHYADQAAKNEKLARKYENLMVQIGSQPVRESSTRVSVQALQGSGKSGF